MKVGDLIKLSNTFLGVVLEIKTYPVSGNIHMTYKGLAPKFIRGDIFTTELKEGEFVVIGNVSENKLLEYLYD